MTAYNLGVRRQTSGQVLDRWLPECSSRLPEGCEGRVVVSFGVNDTTVENGRQRVSTAESAEHLTSLLRGIRAAGWTALVIGPPPIADRAHNVRTATLAEHLRAVAAKENTPYVATLPVLLRSPVWMAQVSAGDGAPPGRGGLHRAGGSALASVGRLARGPRDVLTGAAHCCTNSQPRSEPDAPSEPR